MTYDCQDIEQSATDLVVTKVIVEADSQWSEYGECNVDPDSGAYVCECRNNSAAPSHGHHHHATEPCKAAGQDRRVEREQLRLVSTMKRVAIPARSR